MKDHEETTEFRCPECGSTRFSSSDCDKPIMIRHCSSRACRFAFPSTDDWLHFRFVTHTWAETPEEYAAKWNQIKNGTTTETT